KKHNCKDLEKYNDSRFLINICFQNSFISDNLLYVLYYILIDEDDDEGFWTDFSGLKMCAIDMSDFIIMHIAYVQSFYSPMHCFVKLNNKFIIVFSDDKHNNLKVNIYT